MENLPLPIEALKGLGALGGWVALLYAFAHWVKTRADVQRVELTGNLELYDRSAAREATLMDRVRELEKRLDARESQELELTSTISAQTLEIRKHLARIAELESDKGRLEKEVAALRERVLKLEKANGNAS